MGASLLAGAASLSNAQTPPGTDRPKGAAEQTSPYPKIDKGGMRGMTKKATTKKAKKTKSAKRTKRAPAQKSEGGDSWWDWRWGDDKRGKKKQGS
jgi:hypothetical protein